MFHIASDEEIKSGKTTDIYFQRTVEILESANINKRVVMEVRAKKFPHDWPWGVLTGIEEAAYLLEGVDLKVRAMEEGTVLFGREPVLEVEGNYNDFGILETPLLGLLCQASGVATMASRCRVAAGSKIILSFGARRMHPVLSPMIDRSALIGGCDGVSAIKSAEFLGEEPTGTMPHALILIVGDSVRAYRLFHEVEPPEIKRVVLIDTFGDEKFEALNAAGALGKDLYAIRLDTPGSRRGNFKEILEEVRWELDMNGFDYVKIFVSGGLNEDSVVQLKDVADGFGVGTSISNAPVIDFSMDIVEIEGEPIAKRGKLSGRKRVVRCKDCHRTQVVPQKSEGREQGAEDSKQRAGGRGQKTEDRGQKAEGRCECGGEVDDLLIPLIEQGKIVRELPSPRSIREYVVSQIHRMGLNL